MWFDPKDERAVFVDRRRAKMQLDNRPGRNPCVIDPNIKCDFTDMPFKDDSFSLVVFDPPHITGKQAWKGWIIQEYGALEGDWREMLRLGFAECFRVLRPEGTLIFKWSDCSVPVSEILKLTPHKPLFGHRSGKQATTHWMAFLKPNS
jgi:SAM-dependent methyltransferase